MTMIEMSPVPPEAKGPSSDWMATYIRSIPGILRIIQIVFSLIGFLCSVVIYWSWIGGGWVNFVAITGCLQAITCLIVHLLNFYAFTTIFVLIELISYCVFTIFFLIAGIVAAAGASTFNSNKWAGGGSIGAASFFCFACMILWGLDSVLQFLEMRKGTPSGGGGGGNAGDQPTAAGTTGGDASQYPGPNY